jgi:ABC-type multidrug transport system ATPase subunit
MIEIKNLSVRYGDFYALDHITLDIPRGSWTCLVGPNGAGKTTFLKTLLGNKAYDGSITIDGLEVYKNYVTSRSFHNAQRFLQAWMLPNT